MLKSFTRSRSSLATLLGLVALMLTMALSGTVRAQAGDDDPEVMAQAKEHYKAGLAAYNAGKYDVAIRELKKAYLLKRLPPLLLNIGATYRKSGDIDLSLHFYQKYLDEAPSDARDRADVEQIIAELKTQKAGADAESSAKASEDAAPAPRRGNVEWSHTVIEAAPPESPIDVRVTAPAMKGVKVFVYYRGAGQAEYSSVLMKRRGQEKVGRIPGDAVSGTSLQYYIAAKDANGAVVKSNGDAANPNIIMVEEGVKPVLIASASRTDDDAEERTEEESARGKRRSNSDLDDESAPSSGAELKATRSRRTKKASSGGMSTLMKVGIGLTVSGAVVAGGLGGGLLGAAHGVASGLTSDSKSAASQTIYWNNDPAFHGTQESQLASRGKLENALGGAFLGIGAVAAVAGIGCIIADVVTHGSSSSEKPKKTKKRAAQSEEESSWYVTPGVGLNGVSVSGGFSF